MDTDIHEPEIAPAPESDAWEPIGEAAVRVVAALVGKLRQ